MRQEKRKWTQSLSVHIVKHPSRVVLIFIIVINLIFICAAAMVLSRIAPVTMQGRGFWAAIFYTITMIMDAGCISFIVEDVGSTNAVIVVICLVTILVGMIFFTGGIIGYVSNRIASFIENANAGKRRIKTSNHIVILNWNSRASEIVNDLLYSEHRETVIVLVDRDRDQVATEIENRLSETIAQEAKAIRKTCESMGRMQRLHYEWRHRLRRPTVIVRQGDTYSNKQLTDISLDRAKTVILLSAASAAEVDRSALESKGNPNTVKTLVLVAELTASESSADNQKIIVEVEDPWTADLVNKIIEHKERLGKCNIVPIAIDQVLGQLLSQFSIMPSLNLVYSDLFSNKGAEFYAVPDDPSQRESNDVTDMYGYMKNHCHAIPLTIADTKSGKHFFFMADLEDELHMVSESDTEYVPAKLNPNYWQPRRNILILGHNSNIASIMSGFNSYRNEWNPAADGRDILNVFVLDTPEGLEKINRYQDYPYVSEVIGADLYDQKTIYETINRFIDTQDGDTGILILSDDQVPSEETDAGALTYLIYVQDILTQRRAKNGGKDTERIDVVVEILNPKNYDVVLSYNVNNVVISNRYISKMITQIGSKEALFEFYSDILSYDKEDSDEYVSKELYIKRVGDYFKTIPEPCTAGELIRSVCLGMEALDPEGIAIVLGYITKDERMVIFSGDQFRIPVSLDKDDKLILFGNH